MTPTAESKTHVDAQLSQILELGLELSRQHPARIRRALRTAYAAHFRTLMEFFHDGRPGKKCQSGAIGSCRTLFRRVQ